MVLWFGTVHAEDASVFGEVIIIGDESSAVAKAAEVFGGEEGVGSEVADGAAGMAFVGGTDGLGTVFDDFEAVFVGEVHHGVHVCGLAEEVDGDDGLGAGGDFAFGVVEIDVKTDGAGINEDRGGSDAADAAGGGEEGEGGDEDFIAGAEAEGHESEQDGVGAGGNSDGVFGLSEFSDGAFKLGDFGTHDELAGAKNAEEGLGEFFFERMILSVDVEKGDGHGVEWGREGMER